MIKFSDASALGIVLISTIFVSAAALRPANAGPSALEWVGHAAVPLAQSEAIAPAPPEPPAETPTQPPQVEADDSLVGYVLDAITTWKKPGKDAVSYLAVAQDITRGCLVSDALWPSDLSRARCAILLATLAYFEGGLLSYVDDGRVNDGKWREDAFKKGITWSPKISDDGEAFSLWQIHVEKGIVLTPDGEWKYAEGTPTDRDGNRKPGTIIGPDLARDRRMAIRVAIAFLRKSLRVTRGLVGYTGETSMTGFGKAKSRELFASNWSKRHPFSLLVKE